MIAVCATGIAVLGCTAPRASAIVAPAPRATAVNAQAMPPISRGSFYVVQRGDTVWGIAQAFGVSPQALVGANQLPSSAELRLGQRLFIPPPEESTRFLWPARGQLARTSWSASRPGLEIRAPEGGYVRAARSGRVAVAANQVQDLGNTIVLDHGDGYATVYSGMDELLVAPGADIRQGNPIGKTGRQPLYFEIRYRTAARDPSKLLP